METKKKNQQDTAYAEKSMNNTNSTVFTLFCLQTKHKKYMQVAV